MEHKYILTKRELEEFGEKLWNDGFYDGQTCYRTTSPIDEYRVRDKDIDDRIKQLDGD